MKLVISITINLVELMAFLSYLLIIKIEIKLGAILKNLFMLNESKKYNCKRAATLCLCDCDVSSFARAAAE